MFTSSSKQRSKTIMNTLCQGRTPTMTTSPRPRRASGYARAFAVLLALISMAIGLAPNGATAAQLTDKKLEFSGGDGGPYLDSGFTSYLLGTNTPDPSKLQLAGGKLSIATTTGDLLPGGAPQDNALAIQYDSSGSYTIGARLLKPAFSGPYQSAGIYIGKGSSQFIRFSVGKGSRTSPGDRLQLDVVESNGKLRSATFPLPAGTLDSVTSSFDLYLNIQHGGSGKISALYKIDSEDFNAGRLVTSRNFPRWLRQGTPSVYAGVVATSRGTSSTTVGFDWFRLTLAPQVNAIVTGAKSVDKDGISPGQSVSPGDTLTYTITVTNNGAASSLVTIQDPVPVDTSFAGGLTTSPISLQPATFDPTRNRVSWSDTLAPGASVTIRFQVTISAAALQSATIVNNASMVVGSTAFPALLSASTVVGGTPDLSDSAYAASPANVSPSGIVTYTLSLLNDGTAAASGATAQLNVPAGTSLVAGSATATTGHLTVDPSLQRLYWAATAPLAINGVVTIAFQANVGSGFRNGEPIASDAILQSVGTLPAILTAQSVYTVATDVVGTKSVDQAITDRGATLTYTFNVKNNSSGTVSSVQVADQIPQDTSYVGSLSASPGAGVPSYDPGLNRVLWQIPALTSGQEVTMTFKVQIGSGALHSSLITNKAILTAPGAPPTLLTASTLVRDVADLSDSIYTADPGLVGLGGTITYTLDLLSDGTASANNAAVELSIPTGTQLVPGSYSATSGTLAPDPSLTKLTWTAGSALPVGALVRISFKAKLGIAVVSSVYTSSATMQADGAAPVVKKATAAFSAAIPTRTFVYISVVRR